MKRQPPRTAQEWLERLQVAVENPYVCRLLSEALERAQLPEDEDTEEVRRPVEGEVPVTA